jgi:endonuclease/exonuclease/phosphatase family metal-dependent hydrolase
MYWPLVAAAAAASLGLWMWASLTEAMPDKLYLLPPTTHILGPTNRHTIVTWNTHGINLLPRRPAQHAKRLARLRHILNTERPETIALQEMFCPHWQQMVTKLLRSRGFWVTHTGHDKGRFLRRSSGLLLASQRQLRSPQFRRFAQRCGEDALVAKGVLTAELAGGQRLATVHMQSDCWFARRERTRQVREQQLAELLRAPAADLIVGDFNMTYLEWAAPSIQPYIKLKTPPTWQGLCLDAVLCRTQGNVGHCRLLPVRPAESDHHALLYQHRPLW